MHHIEEYHVDDHLRNRVRLYFRAHLLLPDLHVPPKIRQNLLRLGCRMFGAFTTTLNSRWSYHRSAHVTTRAGRVEDFSILCTMIVSNNFLCRWWPELL